MNSAAAIRLVMRWYAGVVHWYMRSGSARSAVSWSQPTAYAFFHYIAIANACDHDMPDPAMPAGDPKTSCCTFNNRIGTRPRRHGHPALWLALSLQTFFVSRSARINEAIASRRCLIAIFRCRRLLRPYSLFSYIPTHSATRPHYSRLFCCALVPDLNTLS